MDEYIDRGTFKESVEERYCKPCKAEGKDHNGCWCRACWVDDMLDEVDCFQPADVAPVVRSRWIPSGSDFDDDDTLFDGEECYDWQCSACREDICYEDPMPMKLLPNYRPNCGAKMDGGAGDAAD